jgi:hypothetical protein
MRLYVTFTVQLRGSLRLGHGVRHRPHLRLGHVGVTHAAAHA